MQNQHSRFFLIRQWLGEIDRLRSRAGANGDVGMELGFVLQNPPPYFEEIAARQLVAMEEATNSLRSEVSNLAREIALLRNEMALDP